MRVNVYIADDVMSRVDAYCEANGLRRGAFFSLAASQFLKAQDTAPQIKQLFGDFLKASGAAVQGEITPDEFDRQSKVTQEQIEQLRLKLGD